MPQNSRGYCFTINNFNDADIDNLRANGPKCTYLVFGREVGKENNTPHLQGHVVFNRGKSMSAAGRFLGVPRASWRVQLGTDLQASEYCKKEDENYEEFGEIRQQGKRSDLLAVFDYVKEHPSCSVGELYTNRDFFAVMVKYPNLRDTIEYLRPKVICDPTTTVLRSWQSDLETILEGTPDDRTIRFYCDRVGGLGKTYFTRYMLMKYPKTVQVIPVAGKSTDMAHIVSVEKNIFFFNVPRGHMEFAPYSLFEQLKDSMVTSPKYNSVVKLFDPCHVVVFCNECPDYTKMSEDRYQVVDM